MRALAVRFVAPKRIDIVDVDVAEPRDGEILVRTEFSGISSGTEMLAYRGEIDPSLPLDDTLGALEGSFAFPFFYGYSCVGAVIDGELPRGARVFCFHPHQSVFTASSKDAIVLQDEEPRIATMLPLVETALQISIDAGPVAHVPVVVMGLGTVGMLTALLLHRAGARVVAADPVRWRRELARRLDLAAVDPEELSTTVGTTTSGEGVPLVVDASGNPTALQQALSLLAQEGCALVASWYGSKRVALDLGGGFHRRRLSIRSSQVSSIPAGARPRWSLPRRREAALALLGELPLKLLATHDFRVRDAARAFAHVDTQREGLMHAALVYGDDDV